MADPGIPGLKKIYLKTGKHSCILLRRPTEMTGKNPKVPEKKPISRVKTRRMKPAFLHTQKGNPD